VKSQNETKEQLGKELAEMRQRIAELEASEAEWVRAQEALRESEEKLRAQYKGIPIPTGTWQRVGEDFVLVDYNDALEEITRGGIADFVGMEARELYQDRPDIVEGLGRCFAGKTTIEEEMSYQYKSTGESKHLAVRYAFVPPDLVLVHTEDITERKRMEEALKESERRYRELADLLPQIVFEMDLEGNITFMNRNGLEFLGYSQEDLEAGLNALQLVIPEDRERIGKNLQRTFAGERTGGIQYTGLRKDGSTFPFIGDSSLTIREDKPVGLRGMVIDITERVRAEETLKRRVAELSALNAMATIVNESLEVDEILNRAMDEALRLVGVEAAAMLLLDEEAGELVMIAHRGLSDEFVQAFSRMKLGEGLAGRVAQTGQPAILGDLSEYPGALRAYVEKERVRSAASVPLVGRTGVIGVMNLGAASPQYFDAAGLELLMGLGRQISTGVEKARLSQEAFRAVAENASDGIMIATGEGAHIYANQRAAEITGYNIAELLKTTIKDLVHPDELGKIMERYRKRLAGEPVARQYETLIVRKDGKSVPIELTAAKTVWRGQPADMVIFRDVTERKQAEEALAQRVEELERFHRLAVGRELRMIELKRQVNDLSEQLGKEPPYDLSILE
jgi:PAS domain S-box-containing protein